MLDALHEVWDGFPDLLLEFYVTDEEVPESMVEFYRRE